MRALGCIWNDLNDKNFDILVKRTKNRLIASEKVSNYEIEPITERTNLDGFEIIKH